MSMGGCEDCAYCQAELRRAITSCTRGGGVTSDGCRTNVINHGENMNVDHHGDSPLVVAVKRGFNMAAAELLKTGCDVNSQNEDGRSALHHAAKNGDVSLVQLLLSHRAAVDISDDYGFTPLMLSCRQGHHPVVMCLVAAGADVNTVNAMGETALFYAAKDRSFRATDKCAKILIENGADVEHRNKNGCSALHSAVTFRKTIIVKMLLARNCETDYYGALSFVQNARSVEMNVMPLEVAFLTGSYDICAMLIVRGSDANMLMQHLGNTSMNAANLPGWLYDAITSPPALMDLCRSRVRKICRCGSNDVIRELPLPSPIKQYLTIPELQM